MVVKKEEEEEETAEEGSESESEEEDFNYEDPGDGPVKINTKIRVSTIDRILRTSDRFFVDESRHPQFYM